MLDNIQRVFFIGVGGIGMSAIARYLVLENKDVFGYDRTETKLTKKLEAEGVNISYEDKAELIPEHIDIVIYTPAIPENNEVYSWFKKHQYRMLKRSEALAEICKNKKTIAVAGTHGKTTTSGILSMLLQSLNFRTLPL